MSHLCIDKVGNCCICWRREYGVSLPSVFSACVADKSQKKLKIKSLRIDAILLSVKYILRYQATDWDGLVVKKAAVNGDNGSESTVRLKWGIQSYSTPQHTTAQPNTTYRSTSHPNIPQHITSQHSQTQHIAAQHIVAHHSQTQHNISQHNTTRVNLYESVRCLFRLLRTSLQIQLFPFGMFYLAC